MRWGRSGGGHSIYRVFQTLTQLQNGALGPEKMNYQYDSSGSLVAQGQRPDPVPSPRSGEGTMRHSFRSEPVSYLPSLMLRVR
jgi:hypothetical protein